MAKQIKQDATWVNIDVDTLNPRQAEAYQEYKRQYREMKAQRERFEGIMAIGVPEGKRMIFGYNFGKLSVAIVDQDRTETKPKSATLSLAAFLEQQANR